MHTNEINIKNRVYNYFDSLVKVKKLDTKIFLIDEKQYQDFVIYFTRYDRCKTITILSLYYHELMGRIREYQGKILDG